MYLLTSRCLAWQLQFPVGLLEAFHWFIGLTRSHAYIDVQKFWIFLQHFFNIRIQINVSISVGIQQRVSHDSLNMYTLSLLHLNRHKTTQVYTCELFIFQPFDGFEKNGDSWKLWGKLHAYLLTIVHSSNYLHQTCSLSGDIT